tara:strand:- start:740 stop:1102 length:363 start_codon:yes stop_codon:yes gene_type:complete
MARNFSDILGQLGSGFKNTAADNIVPPAGKVIVAIQMLDATKFDVLTPATDGLRGGVSTATDPGDLSFGIATPDDGHGDGSLTVDNADVFPAGMIIYGRWTAASLRADQLTGGIICYYGY